MQIMGGTAFRPHPRGGQENVDHALLFIAGFASWCISTLSGGGGSILLVPAVALLVSARSLPPVVTIASFLAGPTRMVLLWRHIRWRVVRWYLPGAVAGAVLGSWALTRIGAPWLKILIALFLVSTAWQYRLGERPRSFRMRLAWFLPVSFAVALVSGLVGASGLIANPFYLNYGLIKEELLATRAANSLAIQLTKLASYATLGILSLDIWIDGLSAGAGAIAAIWVSNHWLHRLSERHFRRLAILVMVASGVLMLWQQRHLISRL